MFICSSYNPKMRHDEYFDSNESEARDKCTKYVSMAIKGKETRIFLLSYNFGTSASPFPLSGE
jgi:hypothetical protein